MKETIHQWLKEEGRSMTWLATQLDISIEHLSRRVNQEPALLGKDTKKMEKIAQALNTGGVENIDLQIVAPHEEG
jgi:ABC-type iron transport system FetAB ATPase subunit